MTADLILSGGILHGHGDVPLDIAIKDGRIAEIASEIRADTRGIALDGALVTAGLVETHIHLDKSCLSVPGAGTLTEAIAQVSALKPAMTVEDITERATRTLHTCITQGTTRMRTHVEVDPAIGLRGYQAIRDLAAAHAHLIDVEICTFPQEGLFNRPGTEALLIETLESGAKVLGGCPYADTDPEGHVRRLFEIARDHDVDLDFHLDFDLDPGNAALPLVCRLTTEHGMEGRVTAGHVTKLSALPPDALAKMAGLMAESGVAATILPATDLFLTGRDHSHLCPRGVAPAHHLAVHGVACCLSTNNMLNPFTPYGDGSLVRIANLYANVHHLGDPQALADCLDMITRTSAKILRLPDYGLVPGNPADLVVLDACSPQDAIARIAPPLMAFKSGRQSFERPRPKLHL